MSYDERDTCRCPREAGPHLKTQQCREELEHAARLRERFQRPGQHQGGSATFVIHDEAKGGDRG